MTTTPEKFAEAFKVFEDNPPKLMELQHAYVDWVISRTRRGINSPNKNKTEAAEILGVNRRTLYRRTRRQVCLNP